MGYDSANLLQNVGIVFIAILIGVLVALVFLLVRAMLRKF